MAICLVIVLIGCNPINPQGTGSNAFNLHNPVFVTWLLFFSYLFLNPVLHQQWIQRYNIYEAERDMWLGEEGLRERQWNRSQFKNNICLNEKHSKKNLVILLAT